MGKAFTPTVASSQTGAPVSHGMAGGNDTQPKMPTSAAFGPHTTSAAPRTGGSAGPTPIHSYTAVKNTFTQHEARQGSALPHMSMKPSSVSAKPLAKMGSPV